MPQKLKTPAGASRQGSNHTYTENYNGQQKGYTTHSKPPSPGDIEAALSRIDPDLVYDDWFRVILAVGSLGDGYRAELEMWCQRGQKFDARDFERRWRHAVDNPGGGIGIGYLFYLAGWSPSQEGQTPELTADEIARRELEARRQAEERARKQAGIQAANRRRAQGFWAQGSPAPDTFPYLVRKSIQAHGIRIYLGHQTINGAEVHGWAMYPGTDLDGAIGFIQFVSPDLPGAEGKRNMWGEGAMSGQSWRLGSPPDGGGPIYIAEGPADTATIFELTGAYTVCAFGTPNFVSIGRLIRARFPGAKIIFVGDADGAGRKAAAKAATDPEIRGYVVNFGRVEA